MACHFGPPSRPLLGIYHEPAQTPRRTAVLLCYPVGHEYETAHSAFCALANSLAREGFGVLRFDYGGTGDSSGDQMDVTLEQWDADMELAAAELKDMSGAAQISLVGLRFGAVLAARYAMRRPVYDLVL